MQKKLAQLVILFHHINLQLVQLKKLEFIQLDGINQVQLQGAT